MRRLTKTNPRTRLLAPPALAVVGGGGTRGLQQEFEAELAPMSQSSHEATHTIQQNG